MSSVTGGIPAKENGHWEAREGVYVPERSALNVPGPFHLCVRFDLIYMDFVKYAFYKAALFKF